MDDFIARIPSLQPSDFLAETIRPLEDLKKLATEQDEMKSKMELFIMFMQKVMVDRLQEYETTAKFKVWTTCYIYLQQEIKSNTRGWFI